MPYRLGFRRSVGPRRRYVSFPCGDRPGPADGVRGGEDAPRRPHNGLWPHGARSVAVREDRQGPQDSPGGRPRLRQPQLERSMEVVSRRRRGRGEGSVYRRKDGSWCGILTVGWSPEGKQLRRYIYRSDKTALLEALDKLRADLRSGLPIDSPRMNLADFLARWLAN